MARKSGKHKPEIEVETPKTPEEIAEWVAVAAYYKAKERGFTPGNELDDWIEAEREIVSHIDLRAATLGQ